ncbi:MAG: hypothetical protein U0401_33825 [Anaerolineae bacterium]
MTDDKNLPLNSEQMRDLLSPYLDNQVTAEERRLIEQGLAASMELRQELESLRQTVALVAALPPVPAPRPFTLTEAQVRPAARKGLFGLPVWVQGWAALAATLVCVLAAGGVLWSMQFNPRGAAPAAEVANAPAPVATALERDAADAVAPSESPAQKAAVAPVEDSIEAAETAKEAVSVITDEVQVDAAAAVPSATLAAQGTTAAQAEALTQEEAKLAAVTATPTAGDVITMADSQPAPSAAVDQEAAPPSLAAAPPAPTPAPLATIPIAAPAMKESAGAEQAAGAAPAAEIPPTAEVENYAAPAQEAAPAVPATATAAAQAEALLPTATIVPPTSTPTALPSATPVAMLTLPAPTVVPTATILPSAGPSSDTNNNWLIIVGALVILVAIALVIWLTRNRIPR